MVADCAVFSYGQCWLHGPTPLDLYVNLTAEYELAPTHSGVVGRGWNPDTERFSYEIEYDLKRTLYLGPPSRADDDDDDDELHLWLTCAAIATVAPQRVSEAILFGHRGAASSLPPIAEEAPELDQATWSSTSPVHPSDGQWSVAGEHRSGP